MDNAVADFAQSPSKLGKLPDSWERGKFRDICTVRQGLQIKISDRFTETGDGRYPYITIQFLNNPEKNREFVENPKSTVICKEDDILMTRTGNTGIVVTGVSGVFHNNFFLVDYERNKVDRDFIVNYLRTPRVQYVILTKAGASTIPDLNHRDFYSIELPLPPLDEQRRIAEILGTWDEAITLTERLIEAKQRRKKALMQQLLTGRVRFGEFVGSEQKQQTKLGELPADWTILRVEDTKIRIIDGDRGKNYPKQNEFLEEGFCLFLNASNVTKSGFNFDSCQFISRDKDHLLRKGKLEKNDLVLTTRGTVGNVAFNDSSIPFEVMRINSGMVLLRNENHQVSNGFLYTIFRSSLMQNQIKRITFGSAQPQLTVGTIKKLQIPFPFLEEQRRIAAVLQTCDGEIELLRQKLGALRRQKSGLMQQLLTGRVRV